MEPSRPCLSLSYPLKLVENAGKVFESCQAHETATFEDGTSNGAKWQKALYDWIKPFDKIANLTSSQTWLKQWYDFKRRN